MAGVVKALERNRVTELKRKPSSKRLSLTKSSTTIIIRAVLMNWLMDNLYAMAEDTWVRVCSFCLLHRFFMIIIRAVLIDTMKNEPTNEISMFTSCYVEDSLRC